MATPQKPQHPSNTSHIPLVVDLDGTLLRSDMLVESAFAFLRHNPFRALAPLTWLQAGKANLKSRLAAEVKLDVATLPYDPQVIDYLKQQKAAGRTLILATTSYQDYADAIAALLGLFDRVHQPFRQHQARCPGALLQHSPSAFVH